MVRKKQDPSRLNGEIFRIAIVVFLVLGMLGIAWAAMSSYFRHSRLFLVRNISVAEGLGSLDIPELTRLKGNNIFGIDLGMVEEKIQEKYPQIADLRVLRRFPDEICVLGTHRSAVMAVLMDGRQLSVSVDGFFIGAVDRSDGAILPVVKGLARQKTLPGTAIEDPNVSIAFQLVDLFRKEQALAALELKGVDLSDTARIVCVVGSDKTRFDVVMDKDNLAARVHTLSVIIGRTDIALEEVKYIDLRFNEPVIGKKKAKK